MMGLFRIAVPPGVLGVAISPLSNSITDCEEGAIDQCGSRPCRPTGGVREPPLTLKFR